MLLTRSLPPQFLLPAWSSIQLAQAANIAHRASYSTDNSTESYSNPIPNPATHSNSSDSHADGGPSISIRKTVSSPVRRIARAASGGALIYRNDPRGRKRVPARQEHGHETQGVRALATKEHWKNTGRRGREGSQRPRNQEPVRLAERDQLASISNPSKNKRPSPQSATRDPESLTPSPRKTAAASQQAIREDDLGVEPLSLYEELFPEEALAREKREKKALENLERLPAFNWTSDFRRGAEYEREQARERERRRAALTSIPARPVAEDRKLPKGSACQPIQLESRKRDISGTKRYAVLVLSSCSTSLDESDFYRVTAQGEHVEDWTRGIVKVIPARDNMTLEPLGRYYLVFSSLAAASDYLSRTLDLKKFAGYDDFTRHHRARRMGKDQDMMIQSFSLVPADGQLSLKMLVPPFSKGVKWMLEAGGPAPLVGRQTKAQDIVLFTTDGRGGFIDKSTLTRALADDGLRRNLHWRFAGDREEAVVRLETNLLKEEAAERRKVTYKGAARYTIAFKDSNEARRFVREWHRRPFPLTTLGRHKEHTGDEPLPTVHAEICW